MTCNLRHPMGLRHPVLGSLSVYRCRAIFSDLLRRARYQRKKKNISQRKISEKYQRKIEVYQRKNVRTIKIHGEKRYQKNKDMSEKKYQRKIKIFQRGDISEKNIRERSPVLASLWVYRYRSLFSDFWKEPCVREKKLILRSVVNTELFKKELCILKKRAQYVLGYTPYVSVCTYILYVHICIYIYMIYIHIYILYICVYTMCIHMVCVYMWKQCSFLGYTPYASVYTYIHIYTYMVYIYICI